jgi:hypothetical protein
MTRAGERPVPLSYGPLERVNEGRESLETQVGSLTAGTLYFGIANNMLGNLKFETRN